MRPDRPTATTDPDDLPHALRYWLAMIRHEEALGQRLRVAPRARDRPPDVRAPTPGQAYFKLMPDAVAGATGDGAPDDGKEAIEAFLLRALPDLAFPITGERVPFFEHCLVGAYRRERSARFGGGDASDPVHVVGFPTFHHAARGELTSLMRFRVAPPTWLDAEGRPWMPPRYRERRFRRGALPPPAAVRLDEEQPEDAEEIAPLPYALDVDGMSRVLGVPEEHVRRFIAALARAEDLPPGAMWGALTALLEGDDATYPEAAVDAQLDAAAHDADVTSAARLEAALAAIRRRPLPPRTRVYPVAITWDASHAMTTHGLQRDLRALIARPDDRDASRALSHYLTGRAPKPRRGLHLGLRGPHPLTTDQRAVADRALAQRLVCAQGPPGTGKTELILNLAAHTILASMTEASAATPPARPYRAPLVVTSTNNRAVDHVIEPLAGAMPPERLPLALRVGSMSVMREVTQPLLARTLEWLERGDAEAAERRWPALREALVGRYEALHEAARVHQAAARAEVERPGVQDELEEARGRLRAHRARLDALDPDRAEAAVALLEGATAWRDAVEATIASLEEALPPEAKRAARIWRRQRRRHRHAVVDAADALGLELALPGAPDKGADGWDWMDAFDALDDALESLLDATWRGVIGVPDSGPTRAEVAEWEADARRATERLARLDRQLAEGGAGPDPRIAAAGEEMALFALACEAREAWALMHRDRLRDLLRTLSAERIARGGLRVELEREATRRELYELFPVVGCTLLSLGNAFPLVPDAIGLVVVDEAGQCHPAYAVSALARAKRALVIGDPHQLEPVIALDEAEERRVLRRTHCDLEGQALDPFRASADDRNSAQKLAARATGELQRLRDHFRCQPAIIRVSDALSGYDLRVHTPPAAVRSRYLPGPLRLYDVRGEQSPRAGSWANEAEAEAVTALVRGLLGDGVAPGQIAVLTPYRGQLNALRGRFKDAAFPTEERDEIDAQRHLFDEEGRGSIALGTVHRFQGGERDVVIFSTVVSRPRSLTFTNARVNLVNVAISRARQHLVVVGHAELLAQGSVTAALMRAIPPEHRVTVQVPRPGGAR